MKILCLADLHIQATKSLQIKQAEDIVKKTDPDLVLVAGDVFEHNIDFNPFKELSKLKKPVVCCFGNHEFAYSSVEKTKSFYQKWKSHGKSYDVHYLDLDGWHDITVNGEEVRIVGNVLWYDGSLRDDPTQSADEIIDGWLDKSIEGFDFIEENKKCQEQILSSIDPTKKTILLTHCVPNILLNHWSIAGPSEYNMYSGMDDFLKVVKEKCPLLKWAVCGHTHSRANRELYGVNCINVGNDYWFKQIDPRWFLIEEM